MGAATRDLEPADARGWRLGGGVTYGALALARLGLHVRALIGLDPWAATASELDLLRQAGVELQLVELASGPVMENRSLTDGGRLQLVSRASSRLPLASLPDSWRLARAVLLAPVANELGSGWAAAFDRSALVALAWQGLFRRLVPGQPMRAVPLRRLPLIERAELALVSRDDVTAGGTALHTLLRRADQQLVVSNGARGALHLLRRPDGLSARFLPAMPAQRPADETGAGDVFLAAWLAGELARRAATKRAAAPQDRPVSPPLALATAMASLSVEGGLAELPDLAMVCGRLASARGPSLPG